MKLLILTMVLAGLTGCAVFTTTQTDSRDEKTTKIITKASGWTFFSSKSELATWSAAQTEKTQGAKVGGLQQISSVDSNTITAIAAGVVEAIKAAWPAQAPANSVPK